MDLRLVPAAVVAWGAAAALRGWPPHATSGLLLAAALLLAGLTFLPRLGGARTRRTSGAWVGQVMAGAMVVALSAALALGRADGQAERALDEAAAAGTSVTVQGQALSDARVYQPAWGAQGMETGEPGTADASSQAWWADLQLAQITIRGTTVDAHTTVRLFASGERIAWHASVQAAGQMRRGEGGAWTLHAQSVTTVAGSPGWARWSESVRAATMEVTASLSPQGQGLVPGVAIGDTSRLPDDLEASMKGAGMTHMTAVSGSHFAIVAVVVWSLLGMARLPARGRAMIVMAVLAALVVLVRPEASVVRAAAMAAVGTSAILLGRRASALPALAAAVLFSVLIWPSLAREFGFALSVAATAGLVVILPIVEQRLSWLPGWCRTPFSVALAAQLPCMPIIVLIDPHVSVWSLAANAAAAPAMAPATVLGLLTALTAVPLPALAEILAHLASAATWWIAWVAQIASGLPGARLPWWSGWRGAVSLGLLSAAVVTMLHYVPYLRWWWSILLAQGRTASRWYRSRRHGRLKA